MVHLKQVYLKRAEKVKKKQEGRVQPLEASPDHSEEEGTGQGVSIEATTVCSMHDPEPVAILSEPAMTDTTECEYLQNVSREGDSTRLKCCMEAAKHSHIQSCDSSNETVRDEDIEESLIGTNRGIKQDQEEIVTVSQLRPSRLYKLNVHVQGIPVTAVVDTAAEVTLVSDSFFQSWQDKPPLIRSCKMLTAGRELTMRGSVVGPVKLQLGSKTCEHDLYVAPIEDNMLLGLDVLKQFEAKLDMSRDELMLCGEVLPLYLGEPKNEPMVARVIVAKRKVIPPNSVTRVQCKLDKQLSEYIVEPENNLKVLIPRTVHDEGKKPSICVVNASDNFVTIKKGRTIASAQ